MNVSRRLEEQICIGENLHKGMGAMLLCATEESPALG